MANELSMQPDRSLAPSRYGFFLSGEIAEMISLPLYREISDKRRLRVSLCVSEDALNATLISRRETLVHSVSRFVSRPKVRDPVVNAIGIDVVKQFWNRLAIDQHPSKAMGFKSASRAELDIPENTARTSLVLRASTLSGKAAIPRIADSRAGKMRQRPLAPRKNAGGRIVIQALADEADIGQFRGSHCDLPQGRAVRVGAATGDRCSDPTLSGVAP